MCPKIQSRNNILITFSLSFIKNFIKLRSNNHKQTHTLTHTQNAKWIEIPFDCVETTFDDGYKVNTAIAAFAAKTNMLLQSKWYERINARSIKRLNYTIQHTSKLLNLQQTKLKNLHWSL